MRIAIRTDAGPLIGSGHLMRCLALADALRAQGAECMFLCRGAELGALAERVKAGGHRLVLLPEAARIAADSDAPVHGDWLPGGQVADANSCLAALAGPWRADWLVVDHYAIDHRWEALLRPAAARLMVIDDLADRTHDCDLLLDQNLFDSMHERYQGLVPSNCTTLLGPRYALLRDEFAACAKAPRIRASDHPRVLVMFGGADAADLTGRVVAALVRIGWRGPLDIVAGPLYANLECLRLLVAKLPGATLHAPAHDVASLMQTADIALGSPGVASWERCACGLPAIAISQADNQEGIGQTLADAGAHWYLGRAEDLDDEILDHTLCALLGNPGALQTMARNAQRVCDGGGARRVAGVLVNRTTMYARLATAADATMLFDWRNDPRNRRYFRNSAALTLSRHLEWFNRVLSDESYLMLVVCRGLTPIGCVRFDLDGGSAEVSIYLNPSLHGGGLGSGALRAALDFLHTERPGVNICSAEVLAENAASAAMFASCGFRVSSCWFEYRRPIQ
jgi:UDP-2,4-diacetamido-2,4,6-trideoxy-beta-L-altropyranose hydrolase